VIAEPLEREETSMARWRQQQVSIGSFFEGVMTAGYPTDAADNAVQANIVSVGYALPTGVTGTIMAGDDSADCVDNNGSAAPGNKVQMWTCDGGTNQQWRPPS
jgi:hypothetical protein